MSVFNRLLVSAACLTAIAAESLAQGPPPARVRFDPVALEVVEQRRDVVGELVASSRSAVSSEEGGRVTTVRFDVGDFIEQGDILAELDASLLKIDISIIESEIQVWLATVQEREAQLAREKRDVERLRELTTLEGASRRELEDAKIDVKAAEARLMQAKTQVKVLRTRIDRLNSRIEDMVILAPFSGRIIAKMTEVGEWIGEGDVVAEMVNLSEVDVYVDLPERFVGGLVREGATLNVFIDAVSFVADVSEFVIIADGDALARTFPVRARIANPDGVLRPGMSVRASVPTGVQGESVTVSKDALIRSDVGFFVYTNGGGVASPLPVQVAFSTGNRYALRPGALQPGMPVVIEGNERLFPGQPLVDIEAAPTPEPSTASNSDAKQPVAGRSGADDAQEGGS